MIKYLPEVFKNQYDYLKQKYLHLYYQNFQSIQYLENYDFVPEVFHLKLSKKGINTFERKIFCSSFKDEQIDLT